MVKKTSILINCIAIIIGSFLISGCYTQLSKPQVAIEDQEYYVEEQVDENELAEADTERVVYHYYEDHYDHFSYPYYYRSIYDPWYIPGPHLYIGYYDYWDPYWDWGWGYWNRPHRIFYDPWGYSYYYYGPYWNDHYYWANYSSGSVKYVNKRGFDRRHRSFGLQPKRMDASRMSNASTPSVRKKDYTRYKPVKTRGTRKVVSKRATQKSQQKSTTLDRRGVKRIAPKVTGAARTKSPRKAVTKSSSKRNQSSTAKSVSKSRSSSNRSSYSGSKNRSHSSPSSSRSSSSGSRSSSSGSSKKSSSSGSSGSRKKR